MSAPLLGLGALCATTAANFLSFLFGWALIAAAGIIVFVHGQQTTKVSPPTDPSRAPSRADAAALAALLRQGTPDTSPAYWLKPRAALAAAAAGAEDARFRALGALLVKDGYAGAIIDLELQAFDEPTTAT